MGKSLAFRLSLFFVIIFIAGFSGFGYYVYLESIRISKESIKNEVKILLSITKSIKHYVQKELKPEALKVYPKGSFSPQSMSGIYIVRKVFEDFNKNNPDYSYVAVSIKPFHEKSRANAFQESIINQFNRDRKLKTLDGFQQLKKSRKKYYYSAYPMENEKKCLKCHTDPKIAPKDILKMYPMTGFYYNPDAIEHAIFVRVPASKLEENARSFFIIILISGISIVILSLGAVIWFITTKVNRPLHLLIQGSKSIARHNFDYKVDINDHSELGLLAKSFNHMSLQLKNNFDKIEKQNAEIKEYNEKLEQLVEERTRELHSANEKLTERNIQMENDLKMAQRIQNSIIPHEKDFPNREELFFGSQYRSMESIGGDLYDVIQIGRNGYGFLMADVSGHGVPAALVTAMAKVAFISHSGWNKTTADVCSSVNKEIFNLIGDLDYYLTAYYGMINLENGKFLYTNASHHPALLYRARNSEIQKLDTKGFMIGVIDHVEYEYNEIQLEAGDRILLFTDGIIEARNPEGEFYEYERLYNFIRESSHLPPNDFVNNLLAHIEHFCEGRKFDDDIAILYFEYNPQSEQKRISIGSAMKPLSSETLSKRKEMCIDTYQKARNFFNKGNYEGAISQIEILETRIQNYKMHNLLAISYFKMGNFEMAFKIITRLIKERPNDFRIKKNYDMIKKHLDKNNH